jgi:hypothetical protein
MCNKQTTFQSSDSGAQKLAALASFIDWSKVYTFKVRWDPVIFHDELRELVPIIDVEFILDQDPGDKMMVGPDE